MSETKGEMIGQAVGRLGGVLIAMEGRITALETPEDGEVERLKVDPDRLCPCGSGKRKPYKCPHCHHRLPFPDILYTFAAEHDPALIEGPSCNCKDALLETHTTAELKEARGLLERVDSNFDPLCSCWDRYGHMEGLDPDCTLHGLIPDPPAPKEDGGLVEAVAKDAFTLGFQCGYDTAPNGESGDAESSWKANKHYVLNDGRLERPRE